MGVDWYPCESCGDTFPDAGYYVYCEGCGRQWCSDGCASSDGYECPVDEEGEEIIEESTCGYCRGEQFDDDEILAEALNLLGKSREDIIGILKAKKEAK